MWIMQKRRRIWKNFCFGHFKNNHKAIIIISIFRNNKMSKFIQFSYTFKILMYILDINCIIDISLIFSNSILLYLNYNIPFLLI